jgi:hypothetical protein
VSAEEAEEETSTEELAEDSGEDLEVGSTLTLTPKKGDEEQLGLF